MSAEIFAENNKIDYLKEDQLNSLLKLFKMHNLVPELSKHDHVYATSLAMIISSLHWGGNIKHLFESLPFTNGREIDILDILNTMANLGFTSHEIDIHLDELDERLLPCLFIPDKKSDHPIVILSKKNDKTTIYNSHNRKKAVIRAKNIAGKAYFFEKMNPELMQENFLTKKSAGMSWFDIIFSRFKSIIENVVFMSLFINIFALSMPLFITAIYDKVIGAGSTVTMLQLVIGVIIALIAEATLRFIRLKLIVWLGCRLDYIVSNTIFERLILMKAVYTEGASISAQISRLKSFESVRRFFTGPLFSVVIELPFTIILLIAIWLLTGPLVFIPISVILIFSLLLYYYQFKLKVSMRAAARSGSTRQQHTMETFIKLHALHYNGMSRNWWLKYKEKLGYSVKASFDSTFISSIIENIAHAVTILSGVAVITFGVYLIWDDQITVGSLVGTMLLIWRILGPLQTLSSMLPRLEQLNNSIGQINKLVDIEIERYPTVLKRSIENLKGNININNVGLRYSVEVEPVFVGLDIEVKAGEAIGVTGVNGSGKSSLLKLINGLYKPQTGTIQIDGVNIKQLEPIELRNYIAYLPQIPNFFEGTIKDNLLLVNPLASDKQIQDALIKSKAINEMRFLDHGLDTIIYGNNPALPSGFIYTLNLARIYLKESNIYLLDELPNASLNQNTGSAYKELILNAKRMNKTVFFISQRDDYLQLADRVIVMKSGNRPNILPSEEYINKYRQF